jgi:hypothetical protein
MIPTTSFMVLSGTRVSGARIARPAAVTMTTAAKRESGGERNVLLFTWPRQQTLPVSQVSADGGRLDRTALIALSSALMVVPARGGQVRVIR